LRWKTDNGLRKSTVMQRYGIQRSEDYNKYSIIVGQIQKLANRLKDLDPADPFRIRTTDMLLQKLYVVVCYVSQSVGETCIAFMFNCLTPHCTTLANADGEHDDIKRELRLESLNILRDRETLSDSHYSLRLRWWDC